MNLAQLRARTRQLAGAELEDLRTDAEVNALIQEAYAQIGNLRAWKWRDAVDEFATVDGTTTYTLPAAVDDPQGVLITDAPGHTVPVPLREATLRDLLTRVRRDDKELPRFYARTGERDIRLAPTPDAEYTVEVFGLAPLDGLNADGDEPEFDSRFHPAIAYLAAAIYLNEEGQEELAELRRQRADEFLVDMVEFYTVSRDTAPFVMGGGQRTHPHSPLGRVFPWRVM